jgi:hypothetical protein
MGTGHSLAGGARADRQEDACFCWPVNVSLSIFISKKKAAQRSREMKLSWFLVAVALGQDVIPPTMPPTVPHVAFGQDATPPATPPPVPHDLQDDEIAASLLGSIVCMLIVLLFVVMYAAAVKPRMRPRQQNDSDLPFCLSQILDFCYPCLANRTKLVPIREDNEHTVVTGPEIAKTEPPLPSIAEASSQDLPRVSEKQNTLLEQEKQNALLEQENNPYRMFSYHEEDVGCKPQTPSQLAPLKMPRGFHCCTICFEEKDTTKLEPRVFRKCQHALCMDCFGSMLVAQLKGTDRRDRLLRCPVCRVVFSELPSP